MKSKEEIILNTLTPIFHEVFDNNELLIQLSTGFDSIDEWDSLSNIRLIINIEKVLNVHFSAVEVTNTRSVKDLVSLIISKQAEC
jgi:acyl carrier protein